MNEILQRQLELQLLIQQNRGGIGPNKFGMHFFEKQHVIQFIKDQLFFMNEEVTELMVAIGNGDKAIIKPWTARHKLISSQNFEPDPKVRSEAIDMLCFCLNICLAVGITPENIDEEYDIVWQKNINRQHNEY